MGFWTLFEVASMPVLQVLLISLLGAFMATDYCKLLSADARRSLNKIVFVVFTPCLIFASLAKTVTLQDIISWWFMPINIGLTFLFGSILGWVVVKILRPEPYLEGLIIATCASGNLGNLMIIIIPAICNEDGSPFENHEACKSVGLSYGSFSMALGGFYIWTWSYQLVRTSVVKLKALQAAAEVSKQPNKDLEGNGQTCLLNAGEDQEQVSVTVEKSVEDQAMELQEMDHGHWQRKASFWSKVLAFLHQIIEELMAPPTLAAILGLIIGASKWLKHILIGDDAPLHVIQDSIKLLGDATIPCVSIILGANLIQGIRSTTVRPLVIIGIVCVRYLLLPIIGIFVVKAAKELGFLPLDPLYSFVLLVQYTLPPAMSIGTMTQLFDVAQEECSVLMFWTYVVAALSLTAWSTAFMWILS